MRRDPALQRQLKAIDLRDRDAALKRVARIAAEQGFEFTPEEAGTLLKPKAAAAGELSEADLDKIAGGTEDGGEWGFERPPN